MTSPTQSGMRSGIRSGSANRPRIARPVSARTPSKSPIHESNYRHPSEPATKVCNVCERDLPESAFYRSKRDGLQSQCKECKRAYNAANREQINARHLAYLRRNGRASRARARMPHEFLAPGSMTSIARLKKYDLTLGDYENLLLWQGLRCALCFQTKRLVVDHDHETGQVRGLLCNPCNTGLGRLGDTVESLEHALAYLLATRDVMDGGYAARAGGR